MIIKRIEYGLLLLVTLVFHIFLSDYISFWVLAFLVMLPIVSLLITAASLDGVTAEIIAKNAAIQKNESLSLKLKVSTKLFSPACRVKINLLIRNELLQQEKERTFFMTASNSFQTVEQIVSSDYCGMLSFNIKELRIFDALGLFSFHKNTDSKCFIAVLPPIYPIMTSNSAIVQDMQKNVLSHIKKGNTPSEIVDIRDYKEGDRLSKIHWKLSYKYDKLITKEFGDNISNDVLLIYDLNGSNDNELNGLMETVYSISNFLLDNNITFDVEWYDSIHEYLINTEIAQKNELESELERMLSHSKFQKQPFALKNCNKKNNHNPYSVVLYFCSEITTNSIDLIHKRLAGSEIKIFVVTSSQSTRTGLQQINAKNIKESLANLVI